MLKFGKIVNIDDTTGKVRAQLSDSDDFVTDWLPFLVKKTKNDKDYCLPDIDEDVAIITDAENESGVVLGAVYSNNNPVKYKNRNLYYFEFADGTFFKYNRENGKLEISVNGDIYLDCTNLKIIAEKIEITAEEIKINAETTHNGNLTVQGNITSTMQITDCKSSMQNMRDIYNAHLHTDTNGGQTTMPTGTM